MSGLHGYNSRFTPLINQSPTSHLIVPSIVSTLSDPSSLRVTGGREPNGMRRRSLLRLVSQPMMVDQSPSFFTASMTTGILRYLAIQVTHSVQLGAWHPADVDACTLALSDVHSPGDSLHAVG